MGCRGRRSCRRSPRSPWWRHASNVALVFHCELVSCGSRPSTSAVRLLKSTFSAAPAPSLSCSGTRSCAARSRAPVTKNTAGLGCSPTATNCGTVHQSFPETPRLKLQPSGSRQAVARKVGRASGCLFVPARSSPMPVTPASTRSVQTPAEKYGTLPSNVRRRISGSNLKMGNADGREGGPGQC